MAGGGALGGAEGSGGVLGLGGGTTAGGAAGGAAGRVGAFTSPNGRASVSIRPANVLDGVPTMSRDALRTASPYHLRHA